MWIVGGFDPGVTTGVFIAAVDPDELSFADHPVDVMRWAIECERFEACEVGPERNAAQNAIECISLWNAWDLPGVTRRILVIEKYVHDPGNKASGVDRMSAERVGANIAMGIEMKNDGTELVWFSPSQSKSVITNERMKRWGIWIKGSTHIRDATRLVALKVLDLVK